MVVVGTLVVAETADVAGAGVVVIDSGSARGVVIADDIS